MKTFPLLILVGLLTFMSLACSFTFNTPEIRVTTGPTQTLEVHEAAPAGSPAVVKIGMGAGKLALTGGSTDLISGTVRYNIDSFKPQIERSGNDVSISQKSENLPTGIGRDTINDWNLKLGSTPMDLTINAGAYEGTIDLSAVPLTRLRINDGASKARITFKSTNPQSMESLAYKTGASQVELIGLANANFKEMTFGGGAGSYTLDFTGTLMQDAKVTVTSGVSSVKIIIPNGTRSQVTLTGGLNNVDQSGTWTVNDKVYQTDGTGPLVAITVEMGVGNLELIHQ